MSQIKCVTLTDKQLKAIKDKKWHVYSNNGTKLTLSDAAILATLTKLQSRENNPITFLDEDGFKTALRTRGGEIQQALIDAAEEQIRENNAPTAVTIEGAKLQVINKKGQFFQKNSPKENPEVLFVFTDNLQAYLYYAPADVQAQYANAITSLSEEAYPKLLDVGKDTSAVVRTVSKGSTEQTPNAIGFVVKKNAYNGSRFVNEDADQFQDSDSEIFREINTAVARRIKEMAAEKGYKEIRMVGTLAGDKARLTRKNAEILQQILKDELGIESVIKSVSSDKWFKVEVQETAPKSSKKSNKTLEAIRQEALESLKVKAPAFNSALLEANRQALMQSGRDVLATTYPDIAQRRARVNYILNEFRDGLTEFIQEQVEALENMRDNDPDKFNSLLADNLTYKDVLDGLTQGTEAENRVFALRTLQADGMDIPSYLFMAIHDRLASEVEHAFENPDDAQPREEWVNEFAHRVLLNEGEDPLNNNLGFNFLKECEDKNWQGTTAVKEAYKRARHLAYEYRKMLPDKVFNALIADMLFDLEMLENIHINGIEPVTKTASEEKDSDLSEDKVDVNKEGYMIKYKLINPRDTMSVRMKVLLSGLYKTKTLKGGYVVNTYDDLGGMLRVPSGEAYYTILEAFNDVITENDMDEVMESLVSRNPWLFSIYPRVCRVPGYEDEYDFDLRKEFYTTFLQTRINYVKMYGSYFVYLNKDTDVATFLKHTTNNIEGHIVLGPKSIYNEDGQINLDNVQAINNLFSPGKVLFNVQQTLVKVNRGEASIEEIDNAFELLRNDDLLKNLLNNLGISTDNIDLDILMPAKDIEAYRTAYGYDVNLYIEEVGNDKFKALATILEQIRIITRPGDGVDDTGVLTRGDIPTTKFQKAYASIGNALKEPSDGYTSQSFLGPDGNSRFSYTYPDFISIMTRAISRDNVEKARQYIIENYGDMDYFRDQSQPDMRFGWRNKFLADFMQDENDTTNWRKDFKALQLLSMLNKNGEPVAIKDCSERDIFANMFLAFRGSTESKSGVTTAYYRSPLFSDVDAIMLFECRRYTGPSYADVIASNLVEVFEQEYNRILDIRRNSGDIKVENYNDGKRNNALLFSLLPELNKGLRKKLSTGETVEIPSLKEIDGFMSALLERTEGNPTAYAESKRNYIKGIMSDLLKYKFDQFLTESQLDDEFVASLRKQMNKQDNYGSRTTEDIMSDLVEEEETESAEPLLEDALAQSRQEVIEALREYFYNDYFAQSQIRQLLYGDLAFAKDYRDAIKRDKQGYASGPRLYAQDENGNPLMETCMYAEDLEGTSNSYAFIAKLLEQDQSMSKMQRDLLRGSIHAFMGGITKTDGQSLRTLQSFKKIFQAAGGKWNSKMEQAYNNILNGVLTANEFQTLWSQIKPFVYSYQKLLIGDRTDRVPVQHKNSEYLLSAAFTALQMAMNKSPELVAMHRFMVDNDIDVLHFHSVVKLGYHDGVDINHDDARFKAEHPDKSYSEYIEDLDKKLEKGTISQEEYNEAVNKYRYRTADEAYAALEEQMGVHDADGKLVREDGKLVIQDKKKQVIPLKDLMFAQPSDDHLTDAEALIGSQLRNIIPADLPADYTMTVNISGKQVTLNREESIRYYNQLLVDMMLDSFGRVSNEFSTVKNLQQALFAKMEGNPKYGQDVKEALQIDEEHNCFKLPFISPNLTNKIEELILSTFKNAIQKQKISGGNAVLVSNYGLDDNLHIQWKNVRTGKLISNSSELANTPKEDLAVAWIPCYLPFFKSEMLQDFLESTDDGYLTVNFEKMERELGKSGAAKLLEVIGYRIPTEDKYSIMPIKIMGFLPEFAGKSMMLPADIITMSGTDFDIDKLFLMIRSYRREIYNASLVEDYINWIDKTIGRKEEQRNEVIGGLISSLFGIQEEARENSPQYEQHNTLMDALTTLFNAKGNLEEKTIAKARKILGTKKGFTEQEIASLRNQSKLFDKFMEEGGGASSRHSVPQYRLIEPELQYDKSGNVDMFATSAAASTQARHNMFIDVVWNVLASNAGSKLSMLPGGYPNVKHSSRIERIKHDKEALEAFVKTKKELIDHYGSIHKALASMTVKELDAFYSEHATVQSPLSVLDYARNFRNLMDGGDLIGRLAVNSSNHYKYQFLDLTLSPKYQFKVKTMDGKIVTITKVHPVTSPVTEISVGRICAEAQAASPDNGKDPCLGDLNISPSTVAFVEYLMSIGLPYTCIGAINTSQPIVQIGEELAKDIKANPLQQFVLDEAMVSDMFCKLQLADSPDTFKAGLTQAERQYLVDYANWYNSSNKGPAYGFPSPTSMLTNSTSASRCDSPNGALPVNIAEVTQQRAKIDEFARLASSFDAPIKGMDKIIDVALDPTDFDWNDGIPTEFRERVMATAIPRLQAAYSLGILGGRALSKKFLPQLQDSSYEAFQYLRSQSKQSLVTNGDIAKLRNFFSSMLMYALSDSDIFAGTEQDKGQTLMERRNFYIHDFPMHLKAALEERDDKGRYVLQSVRNLDIVRHIANKSGRGITFDNIGSVDKTSRKKYQEELLSMLYQGEREAKLAFQLFMYAYYDNGLAFRHNSYGLFFLTQFMEVMPHYVDGLNAAQTNITNGGKKVADSTGETRFSYMENFVLQYMLNNRSMILTARARQDYQVIASEKDERGNKHTTKVRLTEKGVSKMSSLANAGELVQLIRIGKNVFRLTNPETAEYTKMSYPPITETMDCSYYDANSIFYEIDYDKLQGRGVLTKSVPVDKEGSKKRNVPTEGPEDFKGKIPTDDNVTATTDVKIRYQIAQERNMDNVEIPMDAGEAAANRAAAGITAAEDKAAKLEKALPAEAARVSALENAPIQTPKEDLSKMAPNEDVVKEMCDPKLK